MTDKSIVPMIQIRDLTKAYGNAYAVKGLTFEVPKGQVVGFLGPNGAGKSTTMRILTGYLDATSGTTEIAGIDVAENSLEARRLIGYLPENNPLYDEMMVLEYLEFIANIRDIDKNSRQRLIARAVEGCGIGPVLGKDIGALSKGYRQRVGLAQAILHDPPLLILDEPTSGLDPNQIIEIRSLIQELGREKTVLMSTHILSEAQSTCSRVLIINEGKLVADDTPEQLTSMEGGTIYVVVASNDNSAVDNSRIDRALTTIAGVTRVESVEAHGEHGSAFMVRFDGEDPRRAVFQRIVGENLVLLEMRRKEVSLEETFRRLTR